MEYFIFSNIVTICIIAYLLLRCRRCRDDLLLTERFINKSNIGFYTYNFETGRIISSNKGFLNILEIDGGRKEVLDHRINELVVFFDHEEIKKKLEEKKEIKNYECYIKTLKGNDKFVLLNAHIIKDTELGIKKVEVMMEDFTEEKMFYNKMKESQDRYEQLFKNSGDIVIACDHDTLCMEEINPVTELVLGFTAEELIGRSFAGILHPLQRKKFEDTRKDLLFCGTAQVESVIVCKNGLYKEVMITLSSVEFKEDRIILLIIKDISSLVEKRGEERRQKKELEDFWKAAVKREERIKDLRREVDKLKQERGQDKG